MRTQTTTQTTENAPAAPGIRTAASRPQRFGAASRRPQRFGAAARRPQRFGQPAARRPQRFGQAA